MHTISLPALPIPTAPGLQALLLDVDGTLADTESHGHLPAYNQAFAALDLDWQWTPMLYRELLAVTGGRERLAHFMERVRPPLGRHAVAVATDTAGWIDSLHRVKTRYFRERLAAGAVRLRPGIARLLAEAGAQRLPVALVTNATRPTLDLICASLLPPALRAVVVAAATGDEVAAKKPAPDLYHVALRKLGVPAWACIAIEDAASGLQAARGAGVVTVVTVNDDTRGQDFRGAATVLEHLGEPDLPAPVLAGPALTAGWVRMADLQALLTGWGWQAAAQRTKSAARQIGG